jgi:hypothetical protein
MNAVFRKEMDVDTLRRVIRYSAQSGKIRRAEDVRGGKRSAGVIVAKKGDEAGTVNAFGYVVLKINGMAFPAHRIAWAYTFGEWPDHEIDHVNGDKADNRMDNLRLAARSENCQNAAIRSDNTSGYKGVTFRKSSGKWIAQIAINGKRLHLGCFPSAEDAAHAYDAAARQYHGKFCCVNFPSRNERPSQ